MEIEIAVPARIVTCLSCFSGKKDVRYYLNGINLEIGATESRLIAANGALLGCFRVEYAQSKIDSIIIPNHLLSHVKGKGRVGITVGPLEAPKKGEPQSLARPLKVTCGEVLMEGNTLDGRFPDWRRLIPSKVSGEPAQYDLALLSLLAKAYTTLHGAKNGIRVGIGYNGGDAALVSLNDPDFVGVLMPWRPGVTPTPRTPPDWWADSLRAATDSAVNRV